MINKTPEEVWKMNQNFQPKIDDNCILAITVSEILVSQSPKDKNNDT